MCFFVLMLRFVFFFFKQKMAYEMRMSDWGSDVCSSDPEDYFYGDNLSHGLWVIENAKWWAYDSMGEYDSGIDGDWRRATLEDVAHFGFGIDDLNRELADIREIDLDPELAQRLLAITDEMDAQESGVISSAKAA